MARSYDQEMRLRCRDDAFDVGDCRLHGWRDLGHGVPSNIGEDGSQPVRGERVLEDGDAVVTVCWWNKTLVWL